MLPDKDREKLWEEIRLYFGSADPRLRSAALELQDIGYPNDAVRIFLTPIWNLAHEIGYDTATDPEW